MNELEAPVDFAAEPENPERTGKAGPRATAEPVAPKPAELIVRTVLASAELFHDERKTSFAVVRLERRRAVLRLSSPQMRAWIAATMRSALQKTVSKAAIDEALLTLDGIAQFQREHRRTFLRTALHDGDLWIDLGDPTGECVVVGPGGWHVEERSPVMFRRTDAMQSLPRPVHGSDVRELRRFLNVGHDDDAFWLIVAWLIAAYRPGLPVPILALHGEQGSAKSTTTRILRSLIDPNAAPIRCVPRKEDDLVVAALHSHLLAYDNLSGMPHWLSDAFCRLVTGGGLSKRRLYTDDEETVISVIRPVVVNGIDDIANRADLAERCIIVVLRAIDASHRRDETSLWRELECAKPRIFGALLDGVASALRHLPDTHSTYLPRMADFARWSTAAEPGLNLPPGTILAAYRRNHASVIDIALDASPVAAMLRLLLDQPRHSGRWEGEPAQLLKELDSLAPDATRREPTWPKMARTLSSALRRSAGFLRAQGITMDLDGHEGRGADKRRVWKFARSNVPSVPTPPPTLAIPNGDAGDEDSITNKAHGGNDE